jgi:acetoin utilization protein AcuB
MRVKDVMSTSPVIIRGDETCEDAAARMWRHRVRHLPVVDASGCLEGVLTDRDLRHYLMSEPVLPDLGHVRVASLLKQARVGEVMSAPAYVTTADVELTAAVKIMRDRHVGSLPVVEGRRLVGILTETDLLRRIVGEDTAAADSAEAEVEQIVVSYP